MSSKALLLDLDGTIADSLPVLYAIYEEFLAKYDRQASPEEFDSLNGVPLKKSIETLKNRHALPLSADELFGVYTQELDSLYERVLPSEGVEEALQAALNNQVLIAVVTSSLQVHAQAWLQRRDLERYMSLVIGGDNVKNGKPHPEPYLTASQRLQCEPGRCIAVEDSRLGLQSAIAAGTRAFLYQPEHAVIGRKSFELPSGAETVLKSFKDLPLLLETF